MICVTIGRGRHRYLIAEHQHLVAQGAQLVELRLDCIVRDIELGRLIKNRPSPVIITIRRKQDGGMWKGTEQQRIMLLRQAIAAGVEYVDLEDDIAGSIPRFGKTKRIISIHNFHETPEDLPAIHTRLASLDADIVKIACMAHSPHDSMRMFRMMRFSRLPTIAICMGEIGTPSRILAARFGAPFTYATFDEERALAPGQLSFQIMKDVFHYDDINLETDVYGVIADPVAHSMSPIIHNAAFKAAGLNKVYVPFRVPREELAQFLADCREMGVKGLSVTIPHKEEALQHVVKMDEATREIGACNTIIWREEGPIAFNTDYRAAMACVDRHFGSSEEAGGLTGKQVLVLGAGGAARAIVYGLVKRGAKVAIASRTFERADELAGRFKCQAIGWGMRHGIPAHLIVNCTPVGMHPNLDDTPFDAEHLNPKFLRDQGIKQVVFDTVYNPEQTMFIKQARVLGCSAISGVDMFVGQAALQYRLFTGQDPPVDLMRQTFRRAISAAKLAPEEVAAKTEAPGQVDASAETGTPPTEEAP